MSNFVGKDILIGGLHDFFQKYSLKTSTLENFVQSISKAAKGKNVEKWTQTWLQTAGINEVSADFTNLDKVVIKQYVPQNGDKVFHE